MATTQSEKDQQNFTSFESISKREDSCEGCDCVLKGVSCEFCVQSTYQCRGSCRCCAKYRWEIAKKYMMKSAIEMGFQMVETEMQGGFKVVPKEPSFDTPSATTAREGEILGQVIEKDNFYVTSTDSSVCFDCKCQEGGTGCEWCVTIRFMCPGTCDCCKEYRERELKKIQDEIKRTEEVGFATETTPRETYSKALGVIEFPCCTCKPDQLPCIFCFKANFMCLHSCMRCLLFRMRRERLELTARIRRGNK